METYMNLKQRAAELESYCKDLEQWGKEMKSKEKSAKEQEVDTGKEANAKRRKKDQTKQAAMKKKVTFTDYAAWEKYDVEAECDKMDDDKYDDSELTDEHDESKREDALKYKEKGNKFVKEQKWKEAAAEYTKAIECYAYDAIFYANRALCYLKMNQMKRAEVDCTLAIKVDPHYVKAYQRRAAAHEAQGNLDSALYDLQQVLKLEPKNKESKAALDRVQENLRKIKDEEGASRPISKFSLSHGTRKSDQNQTGYITQIATKSTAAISFEKGDANNTDIAQPSTSSDDNIIIVKPIKKPAHKHSKKPLKRLKIIELNPLTKETKTVGDNSQENKKQDVVAWPHPDKATYSINTDSLKVVQRTRPDSDLDSSKSSNEKEPADGDGLKSKFASDKEKKSLTNTTPSYDLASNLDKQSKDCDNNLKKSSLSNDSFLIPTTSVQFYNCWRHLKDCSEKYRYLKAIQPNNLPELFKESLESDLLSEILKIMVDYFIPNKDSVYGILYYLAKVKRFSTLIMFVSSEDEKNLKKLLEYIDKAEGSGDNKSNDLRKLYVI